MKRDIKKGRKPKSPFVQKPYLVSCYGFKINGILLSFPIRNREFVNILLNEHTAKILSDAMVMPRSFTITPQSLSVSFAKNAELLKIKENYTHVKSACTRNDHRIRKKIYGKLGKRQTERIKQRLHVISKNLVKHASNHKAAIIFEDLSGIRKLYRKGNGQGKKFRRKLNSWSFYELERQISYKAAWDGIPFCKINPRCTSTLCPACGGKLQEDRQRHRDLWCGNCKRWRDRDVVAAMNIAYKGWHG